MKIILAEKEDSLGEILQVLLKSFKFEFTRTKTAQDTLNKIKKEFPDLILIDINLENGKGLEISKMIKEDFLTAYIPIIVLIDRRQVRKDLLKIEQGVDDYLVKPPDPIDLQIRIEMAVRRATHQFFANALTRLPGNRTIEIVLNRIIQSKHKFTFGYVDIDRFKYFNDRYGHIKGDIVIIQTSQIISRAIKNLGNPTDFVGHVGGDDFVFITTPEKEDAVTMEIIKEFDRLIPYHYSKDDRSKGHVELHDRQGKMCNIPLMNISIALINNINLDIKSLVQLSEIASEIKGHLKTVPGSKFLKNRRVKNQGMVSRERQAGKIRKQIELIEANMKKPLGQLLLEEKLINEETLDTALVKHWRSGQNLGETLIDMGSVKGEDIINALKSQGVI